MLQQVANTAGRIYRFCMGLIVATILVIAAWAFWGLYQDAKVQRQFTKEGQLLPVVVSRAEQKQRSWRDVFSRTTYLTFTHRGKAYTTRYVMDSVYVGSGDRVQLLYHPAYDAFRQPQPGVRFDRSTRKSRLVEWTTIRTFTDENKLLFIFLLLATASFFLVSGLIVTIIPIPLLQTVARLVFTLVLILAAFFFTYDIYRYVQYYQHLKANGREVTVRVLATERQSTGRNTKSTGWKTYTYEATIRYQQQERVIPISEEDFDSYKPGDTLNAYYDESVNDFMSVDYPLNYELFLVPAFFFLLSIILIRSSLSGRQTARSRVIK